MSMLQNQVFEEQQAENATESVCDLCEGEGKITSFSCDKETGYYIREGTRPCLCKVVARKEREADEVY